MKEDLVWKALLAQSAPAYHVEAEPPFGFTTRVLAAVRAEQQQAATWERVGQRAIWASAVAVLVLGALTFVRQQGDDPETTVKSFALVENMQVS